MVTRRAGSTIYYAGTVPGAPYLPAFPALRPLAVDPFPDAAVPRAENGTAPFAAIAQSVLGQIGFRVDTRVYATRIETLSDLSPWHGGAHVADAFCGDGCLSAARADVGGAWTVTDGRLRRTASGLSTDDGHAAARIDAPAATGLLHLLVEPEPGCAGAVTVGWRLDGHGHGLRVVLHTDGAALLKTTSDAPEETLATAQTGLTPGYSNAVLVTDDGMTVMVYLDGQLLFRCTVFDAVADTVTDTVTSTPAGLELAIDADAGGGSVRLRRFEAHPRTIQAPAALDLPAPWSRRGTTVVVDDRFAGAPADLDAHVTPHGQPWRKALGRGSIVRTGDGARVEASVDAPAPGRIAYLLDWQGGNFVDLETVIVPPGRERGHGERGRAGLIFWQDRHNYITVSTWLDDHYGGASVSSFFHLNGYEELYDAVWTNVDQRIFFGREYGLRVAFDGQRYTAFVNDEPVLHRALTDVYPRCPGLTIRAVGIVANWEWGCDTGSRFKRFVARR